MSGPNQNNSFLTSEISSFKSFMLEARPLLNAETFSVVGKSYKGTAFVPRQYWKIDEDSVVINTFKGELGDVENNYENQAYLAGLSWLENGGEQLSFCRILGSGSSAGFKVGDNIISGSSNPGFAGSNPFAKEEGIKGKTYFFGKILSDVSSSSDTISGYNDYFEQLGYTDAEELPIVTHVIMMPSGTVPSIKTYDIDFNTINTTDFDLINKKIRNKKASNSFGLNDLDNFGSFWGKKSLLYSDISDEIEEDTLYINGLSGSNENYRNELKLNSFDFKKILWQENNKLNVDSFYQIDRGNYLYAKFPCRKTIFKEDIGKSSNYTSFIVSGSFTPSSDNPDYEDFKSSYKKAKTPWVVSQITNREKITTRDVSEIESSDYEKLFRIHTYDDGEIGNRFRIRITPVNIGKKKINKGKDLYSTFNIELFEFVETDNVFITLAKYNGLDLNPDSANFIGRVIGTEYHYYDGSTKKIITRGLFSRTNPWIYVEINELIYDKLLEPTIIPAGFEEYPHINLKKEYVFDENHTGKPGSIGENKLNNICQTPIEFVHCLYKENKSFKISKPYWGISFDNIMLLNENLIDKKVGGDLINESFKFSHPIVKENNLDVNEEFKFKSYAKYFKSDQDNILNSWVTGSNDLDSKKSWQNSFFHLEKILVSKTDGVIDWKYALYRRDGKNIDNIDSLSLNIDREPDNIELDFKRKYNYLELEKELNNRNFKYFSFDLFTYGGFDGLDIFDSDKFLMNNNSCVREEISGGESLTIEMYNTGLGIIKEYSNCTTDILGIPGISTNSVLKNFNKLRDNDPDFIKLKEIGFINGNSFFTGSIVIKDKSVYKSQEVNNSLINKIRENSEPSVYFDTISNITKDEIIVYNNLLGNIDLNFLDISPTIPTCMIMAQNKFSPLDSFNIISDQEGSTIEYVSVLDKKYIYDNTTTDFNLNIENAIKKGLNVFSFQNNQIKLSSSNSTFDIRKSLTRQIYNTRILNSIKKDIKLSLFVNNDVLFNNNSSTSFLNIEVQGYIDQILQQYKSANIIKNYYTKISDNHNIKRNIKDLENYILRGKILLEMFTNVGNETNFIEISIQDVLSDLSLNSETNIGDNLVSISI